MSNRNPYYTVSDEAEGLRAEVERLREELARLADLTVDVLHGRRHSGELLLAIKPYRSLSSLDAEVDPA